MLYSPIDYPLFDDMGHRLSKIYTRTGDAGTTGLADGSRVARTARASPRWGTSTN
ncbi:MAG: hypothetical protein M5R42_07870 [Rhodocyclaceae bacterium]|nr:hypothetical protein [Rhodocyclaceae bacterium]